MCPGLFAHPQSRYLELINTILHTTYGALALTYMERVRFAFPHRETRVGTFLPISDSLSVHF